MYVTCIEKTAVLKHCRRNTINCMLTTWIYTKEKINYFQNAHYDIQVHALVI